MIKAMELEEPQEVVIVVPLETEVPQPVGPTTPVELPEEVETVSTATLRLMWEWSKPW